VPLTIDDLAAHLNTSAAPASGTPERAEMQRALDTAVQGVTRRTGWIDGTAATAEVSLGWETVIRLPYARLASIGAVRDPAGIAVLPVRSDRLAGLVQVSAPSPGVWSVDCTGKPWPAELQSAALDWAAHVYEVQRLTLNPTTEDDVALPSFALPNRVAEYLQPFLLPGVA
jgi:hypothetical protein